MTTSVHAVVGRCNAPEKVMADRIYLSLWENQGYLPDPVQHAFREAVVQTAMQICHECGTEEATAKFCADTIVEWMKHDPPSMTMKEGAERITTSADAVVRHPWK